MKFVEPHVVYVWVTCLALAFVVGVMIGMD